MNTSRTPAHHAESPSAAPVPRRRLAPNVICMFEDERMPVENVRRRGRYPRNVISFNSRPRLKPGDMAELCGTVLPANMGKRVRLVEIDSKYPSPGTWWRVIAIGSLLSTRDAETNAITNHLSDTACALSSNLRRISNRLGGQR